MTGVEEQSQALCKACGLCCTGHLFAWAKLRSSEMKSAHALGLNVLGADPKSRGFSQPCPLWDGVCTIYTSSQYPHFCGLYKCKLLKNLMDETTSLPDALSVIQRANELIAELDPLLIASGSRNFRERLIAQIEQDAGVVFQRKARLLLMFYRDFFGVKDLVDHLEETEA